jgi:hypothetical protein
VRSVAFGDHVLLARLDGTFAYTAVIAPLVSRTTRVRLSNSGLVAGVRGKRLSFVRAMPTVAAGESASEVRRSGDVALFDAQLRALDLLEVGGLGLDE